MIYSLTYVSSASGVYDKDTYRDIGSRAAEFNRERNITGMLLVYNETIIQFLEGSQSDLEELYGYISEYDQHKNMLLMSRGPKDKREFPQWSMGYEEAVSETDGDFLFRLDNQSLTSRFPESASKTTTALLNGFKRSSGLATVYD